MFCTLLCPIDALRGVAFPSPLCKEQHCLMDNDASQELRQVAHYYHFRLMMGTKIGFVLKTLQKCLWSKIKLKRMCCRVKSLQHSLSNSPVFRPMQFKTLNIRTSEK